MYIIFIILYFSIIVICLSSTKDYLLPITFIILDTGFRSMIPIVGSGLYFSTDIIDILLNISLIIQLLGLFFSFYLFMYIGSRIQVTLPGNINELSTVPKWLIFVFLLGALASFLCIFIFGTWSLLAWIESPRTGYLFGRKGVGIFYVAFILFLNLSWISLLVCPNRLSNFVKIVIALFILYLASLSGSKRVVVSLFLFYFLCINMYVVRLKLYQVVLVGFILVGSFVVYFLFGTGGILDIIGYFHYFLTTRDIYERLYFGTLEFQGGLINASRIWEFIPRFIYPDKPFVYGGGYVTEIISPGKVEEGHNLGMLDFTANYLDFGQFGVFMHAFNKGAFAGLVYGIYKNKKNSFFFLLLYLSLFSNILPSSPIIMFVTLVLIFYVAYLFYKQFIRKNIIL